MVDLLLEDVSKKVTEEIESTVDLLHILQENVPTSNISYDRLFLDLRAENEEARYFVAQVRKLWKLESAWHDILIERNKSKYQSHDMWKQREKMFAATIDLARTLQTYPTDMKELLVQSNGQAGDTDEHNEMNAVVEYLQNLKTISCRKVLTSTRENEKYASEISKLAERCKRFQTEKTTIGNSLKEREKVLNRDVLRFAASHTALKEALCIVKKKEDEEQSKLDEIQNLSIVKKRSEHDKSVLILQSELLEVGNILVNTRDNNKVEKNNLIECRAKLEATKHELITEKYTLEQQRIEADESLKRKMKTEKLKRYKLDEHFKLLKTNTNVANMEAKKIQDAKDMEDEADAMIHSAVTNFQKVFRGAKERAIVKKMLKKNRKGKKKQRRRKKKNKNN